MLWDTDNYQRRKGLIVNFIRHAKTSGNIEKRYIGRTDEPLCDVGIRELKSIVYPGCDVVISSPMKRCIETAEIIYPSEQIVTYDELRECDFGSFEGKNHIEMENDHDYQNWLRKGGLGKFPDGEDSTEFRLRSVNGFLKAVSDNKHFNTVSFVVHGGTIMSILEKYAVPHKEFYDYMTENAHGFITEYDGETIRIINRI